MGELGLMTLVELLLSRRLGVEEFKGHLSQPLPHSLREFEKEVDMKALVAEVEAAGEGVIVFRERFPGSPLEFTVTTPEKRTDKAEERGIIEAEYKEVNQK